jgi:hypothetical protein
MTWKTLSNGGSGSGATNLDALLDVDLTSPLPSEGDLLKYISGAWKPGSASVGSSTGTTYIVELSRWGITAGIPAKPYDNADFTLANNNVTGLNNAIQHAANNGYTEIVLPRGQYAICYPTQISMANYLTFNFNGSTLKVIYDSNNRSPYDSVGAAGALEPWKFGGMSIAFNNTIHSHIINLILIGCRADRSFTDRGGDGISGELAMESSYGISFGNGARHCSVKHCDISAYMGDNITFSSLPNGTRWAEFGQGLTLNAVDYSTGQLIESDNSLTSQLFTIPAGGYKTWAIQGAGYSRATGLYNRHEFDVFYYDSNGNYLGVLPKRHLYAPVDIPYNATKFRVVYFNETNPAKNMGMIFVFGDFNYNNLVEYNDLHDSHRGGLTLGGSHNIIQRNIIRNNGKYMGRMLDGKPAFNDPTRYGINQEDSYGEGSVIRENVIYGNFHGLLIGCYSVSIENNHIYDCDYLAINVYTMSYASIRGNKIQNCLYNLGIAGNGFSDAFIEVAQNDFYGGMMDIGWTGSPGHHFHMVDNNFYNPHGLFDFGTTGVFRGNRIRLYLNDSGQQIPAILDYYDYATHYPLVFKISKIENCVFEGRVNSVFPAMSDALFRTDKFIGCTFKNLNTTIETLTDTIKDSEVAFKECEFYNSIFTNNVNNTKSRHVKVYNSDFNDTIIRVANSTVTTSVVKTSLDSCKINCTTLDSLVITNIEQTTGSVALTNCEVTISNATMANVIKNLQTTTDTDTTVSVKNSTFTYTGASPLTMNYYNNKTPMKSFVWHNNRLVNINNPAQDADVYIGYDSETTFKKTATLVSDGVSYSAAITHNLNTLDPFVLCKSGSDIIYPTITVTDANTITVKNASSIEAAVTVKKY